MSRSNFRTERALARQRRKRSQRNLIIAAAVLLAAAAAFIAYSAWKSAQQPAGSTASSGLKIEDVVVGTGAAAQTGDTVSVTYIGTFEDGTVFDSSESRGPFQFVLGAGNVIQGWDEGLVGMKVGGKRILTIPPELGYGADDYGPIPGNSTLIFQVELLEIK